MPSPLRLIAVHVEESPAGGFSWVLSERVGHRWGEIEKSNSAVSTYRQAMAEGLLALQAMSEDFDLGPRRPAQRASGSDQSVDCGPARRA